jgi:hypothetical protein
MGRRGQDDSGPDSAVKPTRWTWLAAAVVVATPVFNPIATGYDGGSLTRDGAETYRLATSGATVTASAPLTNHHGNTRTVWWPRGQARSQVQQSCATWSAQSSPLVQQGIALRVRPVGRRGAFRAITVSKNIFGADSTGKNTSFFHVHVWRTNRPAAFQWVASFDLARVLAPNGTIAPFPWRICAMAERRRLRVRVWPEGQPKPSWNSTTHGANIQLPRGWNGPGHAGWYVGHLPPGGSASFTKLVAGPPTTILP